MKVKLLKEKSRQTEPIELEKGRSYKDQKLQSRWEEISESNLSEKMAMAFELYDMGLSEETVDQILRFQMKTTDAEQRLKTSE